MPSAADPAVQVAGTLHFVLEPPGGAATSSGTVRGEGRRVVVSADDPVAAVRAASTSGLAAGPGRAAVGGLGDLLASSGLVLEVTGPHGTVATLGDGVDSAMGRLAAGSRHVRPGRPAAVRPLVLAQARTTLTARRVGLLALTGAALLAVRRAAARR